MKIALFGATGFLGRATAHEVASLGHELVPIPRINLADPIALDGLAVDADAVVNCAAKVPSAPDTLAEHAAMTAVNTTGAANLARWAIARGIRRIVHGSTLVVISRPWPVPLTEQAPAYPTGPVTGYAASKLAGEMLVGALATAAGVTAAVLRMSALYGTGMAWVGVLPNFIDEALAGRRLRVVRGAHADFLHVSDAARAMVRAAEVGATGIINVASGTETPISGLAATVLSASGRDPDEVDVADSPVARAVVDVSRMRGVLGIEAEVHLSTGIADMIAARRDG